MAGGMADEHMKWIRNPMTANLLCLLRLVKLLP